MRLQLAFLSYTISRKVDNKPQNYIKNVKEVEIAKMKKRCSYMLAYGNVENTLVYILR